MFQQLSSDEENEQFNPKGLQLLNQTESEKFAATVNAFCCLQYRAGTYLHGLETTPLLPFVSALSINRIGEI